MDKIAVISDIHGNLEAVEAVFADIRAREVDAVYCLGDMIGFGPNPLECLEYTLEHCDIVLGGDFEKNTLRMASSRYPPPIGNAWTIFQLKPGWFSSSKKRDLWGQIKTLPTTYTEDNFFFVHGSPRDPAYEYILPKDTEDLFGEVSLKLQEIFDLVDHICVVGHNHNSGIVTDKAKWYKPNDFQGVWCLQENQKIICSVGSVGQPRDKDHRASYVIIKDDKIHYHRVEYDFRKTQEKIRAIPELDNILANRLEYGC